MEPSDQPSKYARSSGLHSATEMRVRASEAGCSGPLPTADRGVPPTAGDWRPATTPRRGGSDDAPGACLPMRSATTGLATARPTKPRRVECWASPPLPLPPPTLAVASNTLPRAEPRSSSPPPTPPPAPTLSYAAGRGRGEASSPLCHTSSAAPAPAPAPAPSPPPSPTMSPPIPPPRRPSPRQPLPADAARACAADDTDGVPTAMAIGLSASFTSAPAGRRAAPSSPALRRPRRPWPGGARRSARRRSAASPAAPTSRRSLGRTTQCVRPVVPSSITTSLVASRPSTYRGSRTAPLAAERYTAPPWGCATRRSTTPPGNSAKGRCGAVTSSIVMALPAHTSSRRLLTVCSVRSTRRRALG